MSYSTLLLTPRAEWMMSPCALVADLELTTFMFRNLSLRSRDDSLSSCTVKIYRVCLGLPYLISYLHRAEVTVDLGSENDIVDCLSSLVTHARERYGLGW